MIDFPSERDRIGPQQIQQLLQDIEWMKDKVRSLQLRDSPTVRANVTSMGTTLEASAPVASAPPTTGPAGWG